MMPLHSLMGIIKPNMSKEQYDDLKTLHSLMGIIKQRYPSASYKCLRLFTFPYGHY